jgi:hypothetical protein
MLPTGPGRGDGAVPPAGPGRGAAAVPSAGPGGFRPPVGRVRAAWGFWSVVIANPPFLRGTGTHPPAAGTGRAHGAGGLRTPFSQPPGRRDNRSG